MKHKLILSFGVLCTSFFVSCNPIAKNNSEANNSTNVEQSHLLNAEDVYKNSADKVAMLICYKDGIPHSQGSGFFIDETTLVTNFHVVEGSNSIELKLAGKDDVYKGARVLKAAPDYDIAIVKTKQKFQSLPIDSTLSDKIGSRIYTIGNPRGLEGTISEGILSGIRNTDDADYIQITAPISPGNSGGPVINQKGKVIGIATFAFRNSQNLNFAMPIKYIAKCTSDYNSTPKERKRNFGIDQNAVTLSHYSCPSIGDEVISLKNNTNSSVFNVYGIIIYKKMNGEVFDYNYVFTDELIPPSLATMIRRNNKGGDFVYYKSMESYDYYKNITKFQVDFKLLSYEIDE